MESSSSSEASVMASVKRQKIAQSLDPFEELHSDIHELIFQHLESKDILQASMVSRSWFSVTESSSKCGEKLWLYFDGSNVKSKPFIFMDLSMRKYQNLKFSNIRNWSIKWSEFYEGVIPLLKSRKWKRTEIYRVTFEPKEDLLHFSRIIQSTAETIKFDSVDVASNVHITDDEVAEFTFPMLKELKIKNCCESLENFFVGCRSLEKLHYIIEPKFKYSAQDKKNFKKIEEILENNSNLEAILHFKPCLDVETQAFIETIIRKQFKLRTLVIRGGSSIDEAELSVILKLIERQAGNIELLELGWLRTLTYEAIETILKMSNLKNLKIAIRDLEVHDWDKFQPISNSSVEKLELYLGSDFWTQVGTQFLDKLLQSMPNLKSLYIPRAKDDFMRSLGPRLTKIEELSVCHGYF